MGDGFTIPADEVAAALGMGVLRAAEQRALAEARKALIDAIVMCMARRVVCQAWLDRPDPRIEAKPEVVTIRLAPLARIQWDIDG
ncbi:hypothetical protein [Sorangium sp. So ce388]|uniref:hypothetical protein n=1 Tax=Sorangium sp. So ce388 TaxID=3133309 RepID=UPI003F5B06A2